MYKLESIYRRRKKPIYIKLNPNGKFSAADCLIHAIFERHLCIETETRIQTVNNSIHATVRIEVNLSNYAKGTNNKRKLLAIKINNKNLQPRLSISAITSLNFTQ